MSALGCDGLTKSVLLTAELALALVMVVMIIELINRIRKEK